MSYKSIDDRALANRNNILAGPRHHLERLDARVVPEKHALLLLLSRAEQAVADKRYQDADDVIKEIDIRMADIIKNLSVRVANAELLTKKNPLS